MRTKTQKVEMPCIPEIEYNCTRLRCSITYLVILCKLICLSIVIGFDPIELFRQAFTPQNPTFRGLDNVFSDDLDIRLLNVTSPLAKLASTCHYCDFPPPRALPVLAFVESGAYSAPNIRNVYTKCPESNFRDLVIPIRSCPRSLVPLFPCSTPFAKRQKTNGSQGNTEKQEKRSKQLLNCLLNKNVSYLVTQVKFLNNYSEPLLVSSWPPFELISDKNMSTSEIPKLTVEEERASKYAKMMARLTEERLIRDANQDAHANKKRSAENLDGSSSKIDVIHDDSATSDVDPILNSDDDEMDEGDPVDALHNTPKPVETKTGSAPNDKAHAVVRPSVISSLLKQFDAPASTFSEPEPPKPTHEEFPIHSHLGVRRARIECFDPASIKEIFAIAGRIFPFAIPDREVPIFALASSADLDFQEDLLIIVTSLTESDGRVFLLSETFESFTANQLVKAGATGRNKILSTCPG